VKADALFSGPTEKGRSNVRWPAFPATGGPRSVLFLHPELLQLRDDRFAGGLRLHLFVNREDLAVRSDVKGPAIRELTLGRDDAVGGCDFFRWIAEKRKVGVLFFRERPVVFRRVDARHEIGDIVLANQFPAPTERVALGGSTTGEGFGKPRQDHGLAL